MKSFINESVITLITRIFRVIIGLGISIIISRVLGPSLKGTYSIVMLALNMATLLMVFGLGSANTYYGAKDVSRLPILAGNSVIAALFFGSVSIILVESMSFLPSVQNYLLDNGIVIQWFRYLLVVLPIVLLNQYLREIIRAAGDITRYNLMSLFEVVINFIGIVVLVWEANLDVEGAVFAWVLSQFLILLITLRIIMKITKYSFKLNLEMFRRCFSFGIRLYPGNLAQFLNYRLDILIISSLLSPLEVGFYITATNLAEKIWELPHAIRTVLLHRVASSENNNNTSAIVAQTTKFVSLFVGMLCLLLIITSTPIVMFLYGLAYLPSVPALIALMPGVWALSIGKLLATYLAGIGKPEVGTWGAIISLATTVFLDLLLIPELGIMGASIASSCSYIASTLVILFFTVRYSQLSVRDVLLVNVDDLKLVINYVRRYSKIKNDKSK